MPPCRLYGAAVRSAPPLGPGRALTLPCGWNKRRSPQCWLPTRRPPRRWCVPDPAWFEDREEHLCHVYLELESQCSHALMEYSGCPRACSLWAAILGMWLIQHSKNHLSFPRHTSAQSMLTSFCSAAAICPRRHRSELRVKRHATCHGWILLCPLTLPLDVAMHSRNTGGILGRLRICEGGRAGSVRVYERHTDPLRAHAAAPRPHAAAPAPLRCASS